MVGNVALTGATGFIGNRIARQLINRGWRVRALVRDPPTARLPASLEVIAGSLDDSASLRRLVSGAAVLVHCAGAVRGVSADDFARINVQGIERLLEAADGRPDPPRILLLSSLAAREPRLSHYAASKRSGEHVLQRSAANLRWSILRPPAVYGPGDRELLPLFRLMAHGLAPVLGPAEARFSLIFVDDLAAAVLAWLENESAASGATYTLHDGRPDGYAWNDVIRTVSRLCQRRIRRVNLPKSLLLVPAAVNLQMARLLRYAPMLTPGKVRELRHSNWVCDNVLISRELGWQPLSSLADGLRATPGWHRRY
jgi:nucleoside-diphosphate-sugar epimerase